MVVRCSLRGSGRRRSAWLVSLLVALASPPRAHAAAPEPSDAPLLAPARDLWLEAQQLFQAGDYVRAADRFDRAYELERSASLGLWVARSLMRAGRWVDALDRYREIAEQPLASEASSRDWAARRDAKREREQLQPRVPSVIVVLAGAPSAEVTVELNGTLLPSESLGVAQPVDPGTVRVHGERGKQTADLSLEIEEGETKTLRLSFVAPPSPERLAHVDSKPRPSNVEFRRVASFIAVGVGGAALLTGGVFAALAAGDEGRLLRDCPMARCASRYRSSVETYESKKTIATVGIWSGAALVASGVVLYLALPHTSRKASSGVYFAGSQAGLWGAF